MFPKNFFTGGGLLGLVLLFTFNLFPCGNAPQTNLGNYQIPIIQSIKANEIFDQKQQKERGKFYG